MTNEELEELIRKEKALIDADTETYASYGPNGEVRRVGIAIGDGASVRQPRHERATRNGNNKRRRNGSVYI